MSVEGSLNYILFAFSIKGLGKNKPSKSRSEFAAINYFFRVHSFPPGYCKMKDNSHRKLLIPEMKKQTETGGRVTPSPEQTHKKKLQPFFHLLPDFVAPSVIGSSPKQGRKVPQVSSPHWIFPSSTCPPLHPSSASTPSRRRESGRGPRRELRCGRRSRCAGRSA